MNTPTEVLNVAAKMDSSFANGPGDRAVLWVQGCPLKCEGCCNPNFQDFSKIASPMTTDEVADWIVSVITPGIRGLSLSGGEPLHERHLSLLRESIALAKRRISFDVLAFTGMTEDVIETLCLDGIDLLIAGPYITSLHHHSGLVSSTNQKVIRLTDAFSDISEEWFWQSERAMEAELDGDEIHFTGLFHPDEVKRMMGIS